MSAASTFGSPIEFRGISWPRLFTPQYGEIEDALRTRWVAQLNRFLDDAKLTGKERADAFAARWREPNIYDVNAWVQTGPGFTKALTLSLKSAGKSDSEVAEALKMSPMDASNLARALLDFDVWIDRDAGKPAAEGSDPNPPAPVAAS